MSANAKLSAAALATTLALGAIVMTQLGPRSSANSASSSSQPTSTPGPSQMDPVVTVTATPKPAGPPALTRRFTSGIYGLSVAYPEAWKATAGTYPWTMDGGVYRVPLGDLIEDPTHRFLWVKLASLRLGDMAFDQWAKSVFEGHECTSGPRPFVIDGIDGLLDDICLTALVESGGRGYLIGAHVCPCEIGSLSDWRTWFIEMLGTVELAPEDAVVGSR